MKKKELEQLMMRAVHCPATAFHEAGHAVVALATGLKVAAVWMNEQATGCTEMDMAAHILPSRAWEVAKTRRQLYAMLRQSLLIHVAGHVASCLHDQWVAFGEWLSAARLRKEKREWGEDWDIASPGLISNRMKAGEPWLLGGNDDGDYSRAMNACFTIYFSKWQTENRTPRGEAVSFDIPLEKMLVEIRRAERQAEKLLKEHWATVEEIAHGLVKSRSGRLPQRRLKEVVRRFESGKLMVV